MADDPEREPAQTEATHGESQTQPPHNPVDSAAAGAHKEGGSNGPNNVGNGDNTPTERRFQRRLGINEWLTLLVGIGSLIVSALASRNAADTRDIKGAVGRLTALADQAKRQANLAADANGEAQSIANENNSRLDREIAHSDTSAKAAVAGVKQQAAQFQLDQRPILDSTPLIQVVPPPAGKEGIHEGPEYEGGRVTWNYGIKNYGKSTAFEFKAMDYICFKDACGTVKKPIVGDSKEKIVPSSYVVLVADYGKFVQKNDYDIAYATDGGITLVSIFSYKDAIGKKTYNDTVCASLHANGMSIRCTPNVKKIMASAAEEKQDKFENETDCIRDPQGGMRCAQTTLMHWPPKQ